MQQLVNNMCIPTYRGTRPTGGITVHTLSIQEAVVVEARDAGQLAGAAQGADEDVQRPHVVTYHISVDWREETVCRW